MVNTEMFKQTEVYDCLDEILSDVNRFIKEKAVNPFDILEYRTICSENEGPCGAHLYTYTVTLSWWSEKEESK